METKDAKKVEGKPEVKADRPIVQLSPARFKLAEYERQIYVATAEEGCTPEDLLKPEHWAHVAKDLKPWDRIEARANDGTWFAEYLVLDTSRAWARVRLLGEVQHITTADVAQTQASLQGTYRVEYKGPHSKWCVIRNSDNAMQKEGEGSRDAAETWMKGRLQAER